jgi:hypothetical protein
MAIAGHSNMSDNTDLLVQELANNMRELRDEMRALTTTVQQLQLDSAEKRGERRITLWAAGTAGTLASGLVTLVIKFYGMVSGNHVG